MSAPLPLSLSPLSVADSPSVFLPLCLSCPHSKDIVLYGLTSKQADTQRKHLSSVCLFHLVCQPAVTSETCVCWNMIVLWTRFIKAIKICVCHQVPNYSSLHRQQNNLPREVTRTAVLTPSPSYQMLSPLLHNKVRWKWLLSLVQYLPCTAVIGRWTALGRSYSLRPWGRPLACSGQAAISCHNNVVIVVVPPQNTRCLIDVNALLLNVWEPLPPCCHDKKLKNCLCEHGLVAGVPFDPRVVVLTPEILKRCQFDAKDFRWRVKIS